MLNLKKIVTAASDPNSFDPNFYLNYGGKIWSVYLQYGAFI